MEKMISKIKELITEKEIKEGKLLNYLGLDDITLLYIWKRGECVPSTLNYVKLSEYFNVSLHFLFCRSEDFGIAGKLNVNRFYVNLRNIMSRKNKNRYQMINKDLICSSANFVKWKKGSIPTPETLIKLADYLCVSVDELLSE